MCNYMTRGISGEAGGEAESLLASRRCQDNDVYPAVADKLLTPRISSFARSPKSWKPKVDVNIVVRQGEVLSATTCR